MFVTETIKAYGHPNIRALHKTTLEITKEEEITPRGDCIIGVKADKSVKDLSPKFKDLVRNNDTIIVVILEVDKIYDIILAQGHNQLQLSDSRKIVFRKSTYIEPATLAIKANKSAKDIDRRIISKLKNRNIQLVIKLYALSIEFFPKIHSILSRSG